MVSPERPLFAVVLAAGRGARFGATKQLAPIGGRPMVRNACELARQVCGINTLLVAGHDGLAVLRAAGDGIGFALVNERHDDGIGSSISAAARALSHTAGGILILLADQPLITAQHLRKLVDRCDRGDSDIVATSFAGTLGPPALFSRGSFPGLMALAGDRGARSLLKDARMKVTAVPFEAASVDIDTPDDLEHLFAGPHPDGSPQEPKDR